TEWTVACGAEAVVDIQSRFDACLLLIGKVGIGPSKECSNYRRLKYLRTHELYARRRVGRHDLLYPGLRAGNFQQPDRKHYPNLHLCILVVHQLQVMRSEER